MKQILLVKTITFVNLAHDFAELALNYNSKEEFLAADFNGMTVAEKLIEQTGVIGEKLDINAFETIEAPYVGFYIHAGNKIAALVGLSSNVDGAEVVAKDVAMQAAAMNPIALNESEVDVQLLKKKLKLPKTNYVKKESQKQC